MVCMPTSAFHDDDEFPFLTWCDDIGVHPDPQCPWCEDASGVNHDEPCDCLITAAFKADPQAAEEAFPADNCPRCYGDGEDEHGAQCPCVLNDFLTAIVERVDE